MSFLSLWRGGWTAVLVNHLWQSTAVVVVAWLLAAALRKNHARVRYWVWFAASVKFLLPFSLLIAAGEWLRSLVPVPAAQPAVASVMEQVTQPFGQTQFFDAGSTPIAAHHASYWPLILVMVWLCGALAIAIRFGLAWAKMNAVKRRARPFALAADVPVLSSSAPIEPGVFGVFRPVLLLPEGISERLSAEQMRAIVAHEMCHVRRRDNLTFAIHIVVEMMFWFHPMVWWIGSRLIEEREHACDEAVVQAGSEAQAYAEGILNVCKFYVETPLNCASGVTGSELKQRIVRIMSGQSVRKLDLRRKVLVAVACVLAAGIPVTAGVVHAAQEQTQGAGAAEKSGIEGTWQGTMRIQDGHNFRMVLKIVKEKNGGLSGTLYTINQNGKLIGEARGDSVSFDGGKLRFVIAFPGTTYEGEMSADGNSISGTIRGYETQDRTYPLVLERATPATKWAIPAPPQQLPKMAADAKPGVEVATVKPAQPGAHIFELTMQGTHLVIKAFTVHDLIKFVYPVQKRQITGGPSWMSMERWDIEVKPDIPGSPNQQQMQEIVQKVLAERFALKVHEEKREMTAYVLTVGKNGPKMTKSTDPFPDPNFILGPGEVLHARGTTMGYFTQLLQVSILDRPVVDRTGLTGRWDFTLKWTPDETQFADGPWGSPKPAADDPNGPPPLFTAIQQQLDLKLEAQKTQVPVVVIDHVERPSPN